MPELENELEKARLEWSTLVKKCAAWAVDAKKMRKLEADMVEMEKAMSHLRSIHQAKMERKNAFCEAEKEKVSKALQETYNAMLPKRDAWQFKAGY